MGIRDKISRSTLSEANEKRDWRIYADWARFRKTKAAIKLHTRLDVMSNIPCFIEITDGKVHDVNILDKLIPEPGSFYIMDRAYVGFYRLYTLT